MARLIAFKVCFNDRILLYLRCSLVRLYLAFAVATMVAVHQQPKDVVFSDFPHVQKSCYLRLFI